MSFPEWLEVGANIRAAQSDGQPIVALESTLIAHGLPWPINLETALAAEQAVRAAGAIPATVAVLHGRPTIGLNVDQIAELAQMKGVLKAGRRDLAGAMAKRRCAATTVSGTMFLAHAAGVSVFATGGIGGAHRDAEQQFDISADLVELARTPVLVVCSGAKSILDLPRTLEILETLSVPVVGYRTSCLPAFYVESCGLPVPDRVESPAEAAALFKVQQSLGGAGMVLAQPVASEVALSPAEFADALKEAETSAVAQSIRGPALTPFLLARLAALTNGKSLKANQALIVANAHLAAEIAVAIK